MARFADKVVIVTGSSAGIGQAVILAFAKEGASVVLHGTNQERIEKTKSLLLEEQVPEDRILVVAGPIEKEETQDKLINETIAKFGKINVLVNNAGLMKADGVDLNSVENYDYVFSVNVRAPFRLTQLAIPHLEKTKGNIINTSSIAAMKKPIEHPMITVYGMSKSALDTFTKYTCQNLAKKGIRINNVNPGPFVTNINFRGDSTFTPEQIEAVQREGNKNFLENVPLGRVGLPQEISSVYLQLADEQISSFITGACWVVDGGTTQSAPSLVR